MDLGFRKTAENAFLMSSCFFYRFDKFTNWIKLGHMEPFDGVSGDVKNTVLSLKRKVNISSYCTEMPIKVHTCRATSLTDCTLVP